MQLGLVLVPIVHIYGVGSRIHRGVCVTAPGRRSANFDVPEIRRHFAGLGVAKQKTPEFVEVVTELPRGMSGKVKKFALRARMRGHSAASQETTVRTVRVLSRSRSLVFRLFFANPPAAMPSTYRQSCVLSSAWREKLIALIELLSQWPLVR
jgi:hypothetical protein